MPILRSSARKDHAIQDLADRFIEPSTFRQYCAKKDQIRHEATVVGQNPPGHHVQKDQEAGIGKDRSKIIEQSMKRICKMHDRPPCRVKCHEQLSP
jgi:hypothetical protein